MAKRIIDLKFKALTITLVCFLCLFTFDVFIHGQSNTNCFNVSSEEVCSGHGVCDVTDTCVCETSYHGLLCEIQVSNFTLSPSGNSMTATIISPHNRLTQFEASCEPFFSNSSLVLLADSSCTFSDSVLFVRFSPRTSLNLGHVVQVKLYPTIANENINYPTSEQVYVELLVHESASPKKPTAVLTSSSGKFAFNCLSVTLDASQSSSPDRRNIIDFQYSAIHSNSDVQQRMNQFLQRYSGAPSVIIPPAQLVSGTPYQFKVEITSFLGYSSTQTTMVTYFNVPQPRISSRYSDISVRRNEQYLIEADVEVSTSCGEFPVELTWIRTQGPNFNVGNNGLSHYVIEPFTFPKANEKYYLSLTASVRGSVSTSSLFTFVIHVPQEELKLVINGGDRDHLFDRELCLSTTTSDTEQSSEPVTFYWFSVQNSSSNYRFPDIRNESKLSLPASSLSPGKYVFGVVFSKGDRSSSRTVTINIINPRGRAPSSLISKIPDNNMIDSQQALQLQGVVTNFAQTIVNFRWSILDDNISLYLCNVEDVSKPAIQLRPNSLEPGRDYTFQLSTRMGGENYNDLPSTANVTISIANKPDEVVWTTTPSIGYALSTKFTLSCLSCYNPSKNYQYSFAIFDHHRGRNRTIDLASIPTSQPWISTVLPQPILREDSLSIKITITDLQTGGYREQFIKVIVLPPNIDEISYDTITRYVSTSMTAMFLDQIPTELNIARSILVHATQLNRPLLPEADDVDSDQLCPSQCHQQNSQGKCIGNHCECVTPYVGVDCSLKANQIEDRIRLRERMIDGLQGLSLPTTKSQLDSRMNTLDQIGAYSGEIDFILFHRITSYLNTTLAETTFSLDESVFYSTIALLDRLILRSAFLSLYLDESEVKYSVDSVQSVVSELLSRRLGSLLPGQPPEQYLHEYLRVAIMTDYVYMIDSSSIVLPDDRNRTLGNISLHIPIHFSKSLLDIDGTLNSLIGVKVYSLGTNPYPYVNLTNSTLASDVWFVDFEMDGVPIKASLIYPMTMVVRGIFDFNVSDPNSEFRLIPVCRYWNEDLRTWKKDGLSVTSYSSSHVECHATHNTAFAIFIENVSNSATSEPESINSSEKKKVEKKNLVGLWVSLCILAVGVLISCCLITCIVCVIRIKSKTRPPRKRRIRARKIANASFDRVSSHASLTSDHIAEQETTSEHSPQTETQLECSSTRSTPYIISISPPPSARQPVLPKLLSSSRLLEEEEK